MDDNDDPRGEYDDRHVGTVLAKAAAVVVAIGLLVFIGTTVTVKALGLDSGGGGTTTATTAGSTDTPSPLPSSALPVPGQSSSTATPSLPPPTPTKGSGPIQLTASPALAKPMQRINLTGQYPNHDQIELQVQRFENGQWTDFSGVSASVNLGTFQTYVMTGHTGPQKFRMLDPQGGKTSNAVTVTVG